MAVPEPAPRDRGYFILKNREFSGPFSADELAAKVGSGDLKPDDLAQTEGTPIWRPVRVILKPQSKSTPADAEAPPDWSLLLRWSWLRLREELQNPSVRVVGIFLAAGSGALLLSRWPFVFWLPWFAFVLIAGAVLFSRGRALAALALVFGVFAIPFALMPRTAPSPKLATVEESPRAVSTPPPVAVVAPVRSSEKPIAMVEPPARPAIEPAPVVVQPSAPRPVAEPEPVHAAPAPATPMPQAPAQEPLTTTSPSLAQRVSSMVQNLIRPNPAPVALATPVPASPPPVVHVASLTTPPPAPAKPAVAPPPPPVSQDTDFVQAHSGALVVVKDAQGSGSGFIATVRGQTFLFTNIHVAAGMKQPQFTLLDGSRLTPISAEAAVGHDIMRITLKDPPRQALECASELESALRIDDDVLVLGNSGGGGVITKLPGKLVGIGPDRVEVSSEFIPGNSGSPVIHVPTGKVIGIATYLTKRYEEFAGNAASGGAGNSGTVVVRRFGFRLDSVRTWEPVSWPAFYAEAEQLRQVSKLTADVFDFLGALRSKRSPDFATDTLRRPATEWVQKISRPRQAAADRLSATQSFLGALRQMVRADVTALDGRLRYSYFRDELQKEREIRDRLYKSFDEQARKLSMPSERGL